MDIHNIKTRLKGFLKRINELEFNRNHILKFQKECYSHGLSDTRVLFYLTRLHKIAKTVKNDFKKLSKDEIKDIVIEFERNENYSEWTKAGYKLTVKKFFQWLYGYEWNSKEYPDKVKWIRTTARKAKLKRPIILTKDEVRKLFDTAEGLREKALVTFMYESGCRVPDELLHMKVSDVEFDEHGARVKLCSAKVGARVIRLVSCVPYLRAWIENQHSDPKPDSYLWVNVGTRNHSRVMSYYSLHKIIAKWVNKAEIIKKVTPYTFRRTRYTHLSTKIPTPALYKFMGQVQGSNVIERYVELSEEDSDEAILNFYGIESPNGNNDIKPLFCSRCGKQNAPDKEYCMICNAPLTEKAKIKVEEKKKVEIESVVEALIRKRMNEFKAESAATA